MKVLVNGIGNIGTTLLSFLIEYKEKLNIAELYALKNTSVHPWLMTDLEKLRNKGVVICSKKNEKNLIPFDNILKKIDYIFDTTANTFGLENKKWYSELPNLIACSAQGSEKGFGIPYMHGINNNQILNEKFVHIVSCNTHAIASLISTFGGNNLVNFIDADFVIVRRSEDLGNHQRLVTANVVSRHRDQLHGTHHASDAIDLFNTIGQKIDITSSDITTPSQLMHTVRFNINLKTSITENNIQEMINNNPMVSVSSKFDSNTIFESGRRYGLNGRIFSHAIINHNNILLDETRKNLKGWAFIPQEGNTILSTISAFILQTNCNNNSIINDLIKKSISKEW